MALFTSTPIVERNTSCARCASASPAAAALAERLERRQPLHGVEEVRGEGAVGVAPPQRRLGVALLEQ